MGLFNKKDETPKLASSPTLPELPKTNTNTVSELPSLPDSSNNGQLNEEMIKSAVSDTSNPESGASNQQSSQIPSLNTDHSTFTKDETIFVKIDKFNKSQETLKNIQEKITEISNDISSLKETKNKEIKELTDWDTELKEINSRLSKIDSNIFSEV